MHPPNAHSLFCSFHRFATELLLLNQRRNETPSAVEDETVRISDDYSMLSQSLDDILADEGFAELESSKVTTCICIIVCHFEGLLEYGLQNGEIRSIIFTTTSTW